MRFQQLKIVAFIAKLIEGWDENVAKVRIKRNRKIFVEYYFLKRNKFRAIFKITNSLSMSNIFNEVFNLSEIPTSMLLPGSKDNVSP